MTYPIRSILSEISTNTWTALIVAIDGTVTDVIPIGFDPSSPPLVAEFLKNMGKEHTGCAVSILPRKNMNEAEIQRIIDESVEALKLNEAGKLKRGANIMK